MPISGILFGIFSCYDIKLLTLRLNVIHLVLQIRMPSILDRVVAAVIVGVSLL